MWVLPRFWFFRMLAWKLRGERHPITTREIELRVQLEHAERLQRKLRLPGEQLGGLVLGGLIVGGTVAFGLLLWFVTRAI